MNFSIVCICIILMTHIKMTFQQPFKYSLHFLFHTDTGFSFPAIIENPNFFNFI